MIGIAIKNVWASYMRDNVQLFRLHSQHPELLIGVLSKNDHAITAIEEETSQCAIIPFMQGASIGIAVCAIEREVEIGRQAVADVEKQLPLLPPHHPASKYIDSLGHKLAANAPGYQFPFTFQIVQQKDINAFALPGGPIYINIGTIQAGSEAEVAGVLGHEIAHVVMRHSTRQASRQARASVPLAL